MARLTQPVLGLLAGAHDSWQPLLQGWAATPGAQALAARVDARVAAGAAVYPADVFRALRLTPLPAVRVVILGQDPYHGAGQADGLAFSVPAGQRVPPSLRNMRSEIERDLGEAHASGHGDLAGWAAQGVLLLNTSLTVEDGAPASHAKWGWEALTDLLVQAVAQAPQPTVFMLWGAHAQAKAPLILAAAARAGRAVGQGGEASAPHAHLVLACNHPSPLSARRGPVPFLGCGHFGAAQRHQQRARPSAPLLQWRLG